LVGGCPCMAQVLLLTGSMTAVHWVARGLIGRLLIAGPARSAAAARV
jgi:hypothetical protein